MATAEQKGLVRAKSRYGIRVPSTDLVRLHKLLKPDAPLAGTQHCWSVKVLKRSGADYWILGAEDQPPENCLGINGKPVFIKELEPRLVSKQVLQPSQSRLIARSRMATLGSVDAVPSAHEVEVVPRAVTGPHEARFQAQDSRSARHQGADAGAG